MRRPLSLIAMLTLASLFSGCGPAASNNAANKPANATNNAAAKPAADSAAIATDIRKLVTDAAASMSKNDVAAFESMTTDGYVFIGPSGAISTKAERAASLRSGDTKYESVAYDEINVNVSPYGTGAIVTARATVKGVNMGTKVDGQFRVTQIWRKVDDGWKMAHGHATAIAQGGAPPPPPPASNSTNSKSTNSNN